MKWLGVTKLWSFRNARLNHISNTYRAACSCGTRDHDVDVSVEFDRDFGHVQLVFSAEICASHWGCGNWYERAWWRIKTAWKILHTGYFESEHDFMLRDQQHIQDFISALNDGVGEVGKWVEEHPEYVEKEAD